MNSSTKPGLHFLLALLLGTAVLSFFILRPFVYALLLAAIAATAFYPAFSRISARLKGEGSLAALLSTLLVSLVVIVPLFALSVQVLQEASGLYVSLSRGETLSGLAANIDQTLGELGQRIPFSVAASVDLEQYASQILRGLVTGLGPLFASFAKVMISIFIFLVALYYFFKDGDKLKKSVLALSPLSDEYDETIFSKLAGAVNSVVRGNLAVACVQGIVSALGFFIFGVPNPALWGSVAAIAALVPSVGTSLVVAPAVIYLYSTGSVSVAAGLLVWGVLAVGLVDNVLGPKLVGRGVRIHPFLILLAILGGISFFGPIGFLLGPIVLSLLFVLLEIYGLITRDTK